MAQYWYNIHTHLVEKDAQSGWKSLIGPYNTPEEAQQALARVQERNEIADALQDEEDD